ncbi:MAG: squalene cyclase [Candidatus Binatia bacterium]|jgi:squalene cyclase
MIRVERNAISRVRASIVVALAFVCLLPFSASAQKLFSEESDLNPKLVDAMYVKGLRYLVKSQNEKGYWESGRYGTDPGVVGFATLAMLAHGDDPNFGPYATPIRRSLNYILSQQIDEGMIGQTMYNHGFATLALAEAYGMVKDPRLGPALQKAVNLILTSQAKNPLGAWRYNAASTDADTTVSGCQMVALLAARNAGIAVPEEAIKKGLQFFANCQSPQGGFGYTNPSGPNGPRTAIGCLVLTLAREKDSQDYKAAFAFLEKTPAQAHYYYYQLYYASQAYFHHSPASWSVWNQRNIAELKSKQRDDGSWDGQFGPAYSTSTALLSMALNYRFLPIYERIY